VHRFARAAHRHVKLRLVCLAERLDRHAHDHLRNGFTLARVACDNDSLVKVQCVTLPFCKSGKIAGLKAEFKDQALLF
jgi:hypothetical protein